MILQAFSDERTTFIGRDDPGNVVFELKDYVSGVPEDYVYRGESPRFQGWDYTYR